MATTTAVLSGWHDAAPRRPKNGYRTPMPRESHPSPVGEALAWASRIIAMGCVMFLPAVAGRWLDARAGSGFFAPLGLVVGFVAGLSWIVQLSRRKPG